MYRKVLLALLLTSPPLCAQTNVSIPVASGGGILHALPERFGINLDDSYNYGNNQLTANLLASDSWNFAPQIATTSSSCSYVQNGNQWIDRNGYSPWIGNFMYGASYQIVSGPSKGQTGYITDMRPATGAQGVQYTLSNNFTSTPSCVENAPDQMIVSCRTPLGTCATGYTAANVAGMNLTTSGGGTSAFETTDLSPSSSSPQAMQLVAPGTEQAGVQAIFEGLLFYKSYINLNGTYQLTFRAKATAGTPTLYYTAYRTSGTVFTTGSVTPTVNGTPGAGWQNYTITFTASETGTQVEDGSVWLDAQGGTVLIQDMTLTEQPAGGNTTVFRNAVYQKLLALHPGILRDMTVDSWGCSADNMMQAAASARLQCMFNSYVASSGSQPISYGWSDFLQLAHAVGADPWITISPYATAADMVNITAYLSGTCGNGNAYTTMRCNYGQTTPWTSIFNNIYLEDGNEVWNSPNGVNLWTGGGQAYGGLVGANVTAFRGSAYHTSNMKFVASGFILGSDYAYGWNWTVMCSAAGMVNCSSPVTSSAEPDFIDGAPYWFFDMTDFSNIFGPMFTEPFNFALSSGPTYGLQNYTATNFPGVNGAIYETNMSTLCTLTGTTQATINGYVASTGSAISSINGMMLAADVGVGPQVFFALPEIANYMGESATGNSGACSPAGGYNPYAPLWGANLFMPGPDNSTSTDRPSGIALQMVNTAIGNNLNVLNLTVTGTPTYNQPAAQPNPTSYPTPGAMSIAANAAVPYVSCHGYGDGASHYTLACVNDDQSSTHVVTFSGAAAPTGTVVKTVLSGNTQTNDPGTIIPMPVVSYPNSTTLSSPTSDTLPISSLTTYTWTTSGGTPTANPPTASPGAGTYTAPQNVALATLSMGANTCYNFTNSPPPLPDGAGGCTAGTNYTTPISVASSETIYASSGGVGYLPSAVSSFAYTISSVAPTPTLTPNGATSASPVSVTMSVASPCSGDGVYNTTGAQSGGDLTSTSSSTPFTVSSTSSYYVQTQSCAGHTNSPISGPINFTINGVAAAPVCTPAAGSYPGPTPISCTSSTPGGTAALVYNLTCAQSGGNLTGTTAGSTYTVPALSTVTACFQVQGLGGYTNSAITNTGAITTVPQTWYVDPVNGGTRYSSLNTAGQCNGLSASAWVSGTNQPCPFNDPRLLWNDPYSYNVSQWVISGGDKVIFSGFEQGTGQTGQISGSVSLGPNLFCYGIGSQCTPPAIPSGNSTYHTQFLGALCQSGCSTGWAGSAYVAPPGWTLYDPSKVEYLWGGGTASGIPQYLLTLAGSQYVDIIGLDLSDHSSCNSYGTPVNPNGCANQYLATGVGIITDNTTAHLTIQDSHLHGFQARGLWGPIGGAVTLTHDLISFNGFAGWDFDNPAHDADAAGSSITANYVVMTGNGCNEEYPVVDSYPAWTCYDLGSGGFGDSWSGQQTELDAFIANHIAQMYNTKDGFIGPHTTIQTLTITNSVSIGNGGQQWKWAMTPNSATKFLNNFTVGNCNRIQAGIPGEPANYYQQLGEPCRASGDTFSFGSDANSTVLFGNNTTVSYAAVVNDVACDTAGACGSMTFTFKDNLNLGYTCTVTGCRPGPSGSPPTLYYKSDSSVSFTTSHNLEYGMQNGDCPGATNNAICADPLLAGEPGQGSPPPPQSVLDVFLPTASGFVPLAASPAALAGTTYTGQLNYDWYNTSPLSSPPWIGAVAPVISPPANLGGIGGSGFIGGAGIMGQ